MPLDPSGRFQLIPQGQLINPGQCAVCMTDRSEKGFVAPALSFEFYGELYFCEFCLVGMAAGFDALPKIQADLLRETLTTWKESHATLKDFNDKLVKENRELRNAFATLSTPAPDAFSVSDPVLDEQEEPASTTADDQSIPGDTEYDGEPHAVDGPDDSGSTSNSNRSTASALSL